MKKEHVIGVRTRLNEYTQQIIELDLGMDDTSGVATTTGGATATGGAGTTGGDLDGEEKETTAEDRAVETGNASRQQLL